MAERLSAGWSAFLAQCRSRVEGGSRLSLRGGVRWAKLMLKLHPMRLSRWLAGGARLQTSSSEGH